MLVFSRRPNVHRGLAAAMLLAALAGGVSAADKIEWRSDYDTARKEATEKNKPLFLDFGTEDCLHCKRMHQTTFRDAAIIRIVNENFIPLKVDANREPRLAQALRIQAYPTMILAGNDGKILGWLEGYLEAGRLSEQLQRASAIQTPDWMARDFQEAVKCKDARDFTGALSRLRKIVEDGKDRAVQNKAREVLQEIEDQASGRLARVKQLEEKGQTLEALDLVTELLRTYAGTQAATDAGKLMTMLADKPDIRTKQRNRKALELLATAREDLKFERYLNCLESCELLGAAYRDLPAGKEGAQLADEIKASPDKMARVCEAMNDRLAQMYVTLADSFLKQGQLDQAQVYLEKVVKLNPTPALAATASARLDKIQGKTPGMTTNFPKP